LRNLSEKNMDKNMLLILGLIIVIIGALFIYPLLSTRTAGEELRDIAVEKAEKISGIIGKNVAETEALSLEKTILDSVIEANKFYAGKTDAEINEGIMQIDRHWIIAKKTGDQTEKSIEVLNNELAKYLKDYQNKNPDKYGEIFVTDAKGAAIGSTKFLSDYYQADEEWWQKTYNNGVGSVFLDDRGYDETADTIVLGTVVPIMENGKTIGVLKINYKVTEIINIVSKSQSEDTGVLLARIPGELIVYSQGIISKLPSKKIDAIIESGSGWTEYEAIGKKSVIGYAPISADIQSRFQAMQEIMGITGERWQPVTWYFFIEKHV